MTLQFYVNNQTLSLNPAQRNIKIASDSKNYLKARFIFQTSEWTRGILRYAIFTYNGNSYKKFLGVEPGLKYNECYVSPEVIKPGQFTVSVFCDELITSTMETIKVDPSGYTENIVNQESSGQITLDKMIDERIQEYLFNTEFIIDANEIKENTTQ